MINLVIDSDITASDAEVVVNTVNCVGVMGKGVALAFRRRYPALYRDYRAACSKGEVRPGHIWIWHGEITVLCAATKNHWRHPSRYEWVVSCLREIADHCRREGVRSLALPLLGAGNGGLSKERVLRMTVAALRHLRATVYIYIPGSMINEQCVGCNRQPTCRLWQEGFEDLCRAKAI